MIDNAEHTSPKAISDPCLTFKSSEVVPESFHYYKQYHFTSFGNTPNVYSGSRAHSLARHLAANSRIDLSQCITQTLDTWSIK